MLHCRSPSTTRTCPQREHRRNSAYPADPISSTEGCGQSWTTAGGTGGAPAAGADWGSGAAVRTAASPSAGVAAVGISAGPRKICWRQTGTRRVAVGAGVTSCWYKYVGLNGKIIGLDRVGESAPAGALFKEFGFTVENVVATVASL